MKANELRIGNLVYDVAKNPIQISAWRIYDFANQLGIEPIPLTGEWLEKLGLYFDGASYYHKEGIGTQKWKMRVWNMWDLWRWQVDAYFTVQLKYVHQLQNLYFAITNNELEIKPHNQ